MINQINNNLDERIVNAVLDTAISICAIDSDGLIVQTNFKFNQQLGYNEGELLHSNFFDLIPDDYRNIELEMDAHFWAEQFGYDSVFKIERKDGTHLYFEATFTYLEDDSSPLKVATLNDVTEKVERETQLKKTNAFLSTMIDSAPIGVVLIDQHGIVESWNEHAESIFGWSSDEVIGKMLPYVPPHKRDEFDENLKEAFSREENFMLELERMDNYGETIYLREFITPIKTDNETVENVLLLIEDITDTTLVQKALIDSEMKYRNLVEASNDLILKTNLRGMITFTNQAANDVLGYTPFEMIGKNSLRFVHETAKKDWYNIYKELKLGKSFTNIDLHLQNANGEKVSVNANFQSTLNEEGDVVGFSCYAADISDRINYQNHLESMVKEKEILIKEIHHRVKNNLAVVSGLLSLQSTTLKSEAAKRAFSESQARIKSIATIHEKLYQNELFTNVEIKNYLEQLVKDISNAYRDPNKNITTNVVGDEVHLNVNQAVPFGIMSNELLINAHKYAFENRIYGEIEVRIEKNEEGQVTVSVADNGVGLPDNFDSNEDGTSLGMILIRSLSTQLDAQLKVFRENGTRFSISFIPDE